jgi:hypothetical protein
MVSLSNHVAISFRILRQDQDERIALTALRSRQSSPLPLVVSLSNHPNPVSPHPVIPAKAGIQPLENRMPKISETALSEVRAAFERYRLEVAATGMTRESKKTYLGHSEQFVRWLGGNFTPGINTRRR